MKEKQQQPVVSVENCPHCFDNAQKHLIVSLGKHAYMSVPSSESLIDGHCFIVPMSHQSSSVTCDEEVWNEIQDFKKGLIKMFQANNKDCIFLEQYSSHKRIAHMIIECVPLEFDVSNLAPIYFKVKMLNI
jgi:hypothetical protein